MLQMENLIARMQAEHTGVQVRTVKSFISKIPSVFTGMTQYACFSETILSIDVKNVGGKKLKTLKPLKTLKNKLTFFIIKTFQ